MTSRRIIVVGLCGLAGLTAAGVATAVLHTADSTPPRPNISSPASTRSVIAKFAPEPGRADRMIVIQRTPDGFFCFWDSPDPLGAKGLGGCNPAPDPLGGRKLFVNLAYDGGPDATSVHDARLSGLVTSAVATAELVMSDGTARALSLRRTPARAIAGADYRVFAYRLRDVDLANGITPVEVVVRDPDGAVLDRQTTGIG